MRILALLWDTTLCLSDRTDHLLYNDASCLYLNRNALKFINNYIFSIKQLKLSLYSRT